MPTPREGEDRDEFMERCVPQVIDDGTAEDQEQAVAVCSSMWEDAQEGGNEEDSKTIRKTFKVDIEEKTSTGGRITISTGDLDRDKDRVMPHGAIVQDYLKNPVVQYGHNYQDPWATVGRTVGLTVNDKGLAAEFELRPAANEQDPQNIVRLLWEGEWIRTASIGFVPLEFEENEEGGRDYTSWQLLEWSLVPVPANQNALRMAVKALGEDEPLTESFFKSVEQKRGRVLSGANEGKLRKARDLLSEVISQVEEQTEDEKGAALSQKPPERKSTEIEEKLDERFVWDVLQKFQGSPRNPYGTHSSYKFKGGASGYNRAWRLHFSQIGGGATTGNASGPIRGTVRRTEMIAAARKPPCKLPSTDSIAARTGPKSPLEGEYPEKPGDYGLDSWKSPETDEEREGVKLSCSDLATIKRAALAEIKRRANDRENEEGKTAELYQSHTEPYTDAPATETDVINEPESDDAEWLEYLRAFLDIVEQTLH